MQLYFAGKLILEHNKVYFIQIALEFKHKLFVLISKDAVKN